MQTKLTPQLPVTFLAQFVARWQEENPVFFQLIKKYATYIAIGGIVLWAFLSYVVLPALTEANLTTPKWLALIQSVLNHVAVFLMGLGTGGYVVAGTTLSQASPPVQTQKPTVESLQQELETLRAQVLAKSEAEPGAGTINGAGGSGPVPLNG